jgi:hypothetical protein
MAITAIDIFQTNIIGSVNAMAVHSPLVFLADATYSNAAPDYIYFEILIAGESKLTGRCIYVKDISSTQRRFKFDAAEILRGYMPSFDDFVQSGGSQVLATNISKEITVNFKSDLEGTVQTPIVIDCIHSARQIGQTACLTDVVLNASEIFIGGENLPVYVYFYNTQGGEVPPENTSYALDYDDAFFTDWDGSKFTITNI